MPLSLMGLADRLPFASSHCKCCGHVGFGRPRSNLFAKVAVEFSHSLGQKRALPCQQAPVRFVNGRGIGPVSIEVEEPGYGLREFVHAKLESIRCDVASLTPQG